MEHPPKQGLKRIEHIPKFNFQRVLMEHPPKQGLKPQFLFPILGNKLF